MGLHSQRKVVCYSCLLEKSKLSRKPLLPPNTFPSLKLNRDGVRALEKQRGCASRLTQTDSNFPAVWEPGLGSGDSSLPVPALKEATLHDFEIFQ